jgi:hypothetical protein
MIRSGRALVLLVGSLLPACSGGGTAVPTGAVVEITSDFETPPLDGVQLTVTGARSTVFYDHTFSLSSGRYGLPLRVGLEPHGDPNASFRVTAVGQINGAAIVERSATLHFIVGRVVLLELPLQMICQGQNCPGAANTCVGNGAADCVPDTIDPGKLPTYQPADGGAGAGGHGNGGASGRGGAAGGGGVAGFGGSIGGVAGTGGGAGAGGIAGTTGTGGSGGAGVAGTGGATGRGGGGEAGAGGTGGGSGGAGGGAGGGGMTGTGGRGGAGGTSGSAGTGGASGSPGTGGTGGASGSAGTGGRGGGSGTGGSGGAAGSGGTGGGTVVMLNEQLVGYWSFDAAGTSSPDYSGNGNNITAVAGQWTASGADGGALDLSAPNAAVSVPASVSVNGITSAISIAAWVKPGSTGMVRTIISRYLGTSYWKLGFAENGALRFVAGTGSVQTGSGVSDPTDWTHVVATYDGATARLYVDGTLSASANLGAISLVGGPTTGGGYGPLLGGTFMDVTADTIEDYGGQIDELALYKRALNSAEATALAHGATPSRH